LPFSIPASTESLLIAFANLAIPYLSSSNEYFTISSCCALRLVSIIITMTNLIHLCIFFFGECSCRIQLAQYRICGILACIERFVIFLEKNAQIIKNPIFNCPNAEVPGLRTFLRKWFRVFGYCFSFGFLIT